MPMAKVPLNTSCMVIAAPSLRLIELGFYEGCIVRPLYVCAGGGTRVYSIKHTLIALRDTDATQIQAKVVEA